ncbi:hypothetical protein EHQ81_14555 [Leptospira selangorensis]|uniref:Uncharacterized protein n=1 Tax=Leptospira selangorensis TaxID=2484982 RepID=A0A5F2BX88_9LEPT|nr:hypothetical protein [Leptospira selangorensis]TGM12286.1 hypothetical protein EHQ81_14555 [Leptospira selangorensis]TGM14671.1 hypothetical protein EHQ82_18055 [Leptospira selangorensis]
MLSKRFLSNSIFYKFIIFLFAILVLDCGLALGYQAEEEAAQASENKNSNNPILAALGLSSEGGTGGGASSGLLTFNPTSLNFSASQSKDMYALTVPSWPGTGPGQFDFDVEWTGNGACSAPSQTFSVPDDVTFPLLRAGITFSCDVAGTGQLRHVITSSSGTGLPTVGTVIGILQVTVTP